MYLWTDVLNISSELQCDSNRSFQTKISFMSPQQFHPMRLLGPGSKYSTSLLRCDRIGAGIAVAGKRKGRLT